jgi:tRNA (guanine37-N1)-methyltransferase
MNISILSVFPELYKPFLSTSLVGRAVQSGLVSFHVQDFFSYSEPKERIDAPTYGPGAGMILKPEIVQKAIEDCENQRGKAFKIFFSPQGKKLDQPLARQLAQQLAGKHVMLVASRYEGMDTRVEEEYADLELSIGDYVVLGGDLPAMVFIETFLRLVPGVVGKEESVVCESFSGAFLDHPEYGPPVVWKDQEVPEILRSGHHEKIKQWRHEQAARKSIVRRFDWVRSHAGSDKDRATVARLLPAHYAALMHVDIRLPHDQIGTTSVTSLDIHDIARSACTYGIKNYFVVTPLSDQQRLVETLRSFWMSEVGIDYNPERHEAVRRVQLVAQLDDVVAAIREKEGIDPLIIATSARPVGGRAETITFNDHEKVFSHNRPVLFLFGTGRGLADVVFERCDYVLIPLEGFSEYNHLSVRSAAAVIFDRWLGTTGKREGN